MDLSGTIRKLRREKDVTQEKLAASLGVSFQTVSKWERGEVYPDVTLLPHIASYFGITVDELLGVSELQQRERLDWYANRINELINDNKFVEQEALTIERYREFPNDFTSKCHYIMQMCNNMLSSRDFSRMEEIIALGDDILDRKSPNAKTYITTSGVAELLMRVCIAAGDRERAREYVSLGGRSVLHDNLAQVYEGEDAVQAARSAVMQHLQILARNVNIIIEQGKFDPENTIRALKSLIGIYSAVHDDGNLTFYLQIISQYRRRIAAQYLLLDDTETAFEWLSQAAGDAEQYAVHYHDKATSPIMEGEQLINGFPQSAAEEMLKALGFTVYDGVRNDARFAEIEARLRAVVEQCADQPE